MVYPICSAVDVDSFVNQLFCNILIKNSYFCLITHFLLCWFIITIVSNNRAVFYCIRSLEVIFPFGFLLWNCQYLYSFWLFLLLLSYCVIKFLFVCCLSPFRCPSLGSQIYVLADTNDVRPCGVLDPDGACFNRLGHCWPYGALPPEFLTTYLLPTVRSRGCRLKKESCWLSCKDSTCKTRLYWLPCVESSRKRALFCRADFRSIFSACLLLFRLISVLCSYFKNVTSSLDLIGVITVVISVDHFCFGARQSKDYCEKF